MPPEAFHAALAGNNSVRFGFLTETWRGLRNRHHEDGAKRLPAACRRHRPSKFRAGPPPGARPARAHTQAAGWCAHARMVWHGCTRASTGSSRHQGSIGCSSEAAAPALRWAGAKALLVRGPRARSPRPPPLLFSSSPPSPFSWLSSASYNARGTAITGHAAADCGVGGGRCGPRRRSTCGWWWWAGTCGSARHSTTLRATSTPCWIGAMTRLSVRRVRPGARRETRRGAAPRAAHPAPKSARASSKLVRTIFGVVAHTALSHDPCDGAAGGVRPCRRPSPDPRSSVRRLVCA